LEIEYGTFHWFVFSFYHHLFLPLDSILLATLPYGKQIIANVDGGHFEGHNKKGTFQPPTGNWLLIQADNSVQLDVPYIIGQRR